MAAVSGGEGGGVEGESAFLERNTHILSLLGDGWWVGRC